MSDFQDGLSLLEEQLPDWWAFDDPTSELAKILAAIGDLIDSLSDGFQVCGDDRVLVKSSDDGLTRTWDVVWGIESEETSKPAGVLIPYIQARMNEDGSVSSLINTLMALLSISPSNFAVGTLALFAAGGGGLTFPANGTGITLWQWDGSSAPLPGTALAFPTSGLGLIFPPLGTTAFGFQTTAIDGTSGVGTGFATPLIFGLNGYVWIVQNFTAYQFTVFVRSALVFDRGLFKRAVARFRPAHTLPPIITEVP